MPSPEARPNFLKQRRAQTPAFVAIGDNKFKALNKFSILHLGNDNYQMKFQLIRKYADVIREAT